MSAGCVMLCHGRLDRVEAVAQHLCAQGMPVALHVDRGTRVAPEQLARLAALPGLILAERRRSGWGSWNLVEATLGAVRALLARHPAIGHVCLVSGSCLPLRPVADLDRFLADQPGRDFIESVRISRADWVMGGLQEERFGLRFPFGYRERRRLFDLSTRLQRSLPVGWQRRLPPGLDPCLGSQWWCLSRATLEAILADPGLPRARRYFRGVWIPDEAFFQTMARRHSRDLSARSLTFAPFDRTGRPVMFYDDHAGALPQIARGHFFLRKAWEGADRLYAAALDPAAGPATSGSGAAASIAARATVPPPLTPAIPRRDAPPGKAPYLAVYGLEGFAPDRAGSWLVPAFRPPPGKGRPLSAAALNPSAHLSNLLRSAPGLPVLALGPDTPPEALRAVARDPLARIAAVAGGWILPMASRRDEAVAKEFARLQQCESLLLASLAGPDRRAQLQLWTLAEALAAPDDVALALGLPGAAIPDLQIAALGRFLERMRDAGLNPAMSVPMAGCGLRQRRGQEAG
ncbi:beta-1,6-N-acetylglucosaminyltransferase [Poseidonocella sp. HB161398]|uniref:beta-1,6-N-acetylglucosaminyltransferase n=1 Tax=Poseidonocella sp. HB161398 TaxID=2320855 RepID=UPI00110A07DE|nr:beta-1,6-N-acetylglucosaminyltransferase [Poseidonocella sp. HB161398]